MAAERESRLKRRVWIRYLLVGVCVALAAITLARGVTPWTPQTGLALHMHTQSSREHASGDVHNESEGIEEDPQRLGLHVTAAELAEWRKRAARGPYRIPGDESPNSPGDWMRIREHTANFMAEPDAVRWNGPTENNPGDCVRHSPNSTEDRGYNPPILAPAELRDTAFYALIIGSDKHATAAAAQLLAQAREPNLDFGYRSRWCLKTVMGDNNPVFNIANWMTKLLFAYDYLLMYDKDLFAEAELQLLDQWFFDAAAWMQPVVDDYLSELFINRSTGDYRMTATAKDDWRASLYEGGPVAQILQRRYNNRVAVAIRFITLVGVHQDHDSFISTGTLFFKEALKFAYYPEGVLAEFYRGTRSDPAKGWKYGAEFTGSLITIADTLARAGNTSLYEFKTTDGAMGTQSAKPKSLHSLIRDMLRYVDGTYRRYVDDGALIDPAGEAWIHDTMLAMANRYYRDSYLFSVYTRDEAPQYPSEARRSQGDPEGGEWGIYPGSLFMFGKMERKSSPYP